MTFCEWRCEAEVDRVVGPLRRDARSTSPGFPSRRRRSERWAGDGSDMTRPVQRGVVPVPWLRSRQLSSSAYMTILPSISRSSSLRPVVLRQALDSSWRCRLVLRADKGRVA